MSQNVPGIHDFLRHDLRTVLGLSSSARPKAYLTLLPGVKTYPAQTEFFGFQWLFEEAPTGSVGYRLDLPLHTAVTAVTAAAVAHVFIGTLKSRRKFAFALIVNETTHIAR